MEFFERVNQLLEILSAAAEELGRCSDRGGYDPAKLESLVERITVAQRTLGDRILGWKKHNAADPAQQILLREWTIAKEELGGWEIQYDTDFYKEAKEIGIKLQEPPWRKTIPLPPACDLPDYPPAGEDICIDRRWEVSTFCKMLKHDPSIPQHIFAFQVDGGKGKSKLLNRFEQICAWVTKQNQPLLYALVDFRDRQRTPHFLAYDIVELTHRNARAIDSISVEELAPLSKLRSSIRESIKSIPISGTTASHELELTDLAGEMSDCLRELSRKYTLVWIFDTFEQAGEGGDWLLSDCLPNFRKLHRVVVILAGRSGLNGLQSSSDVVFRDTLEPLQYWEDCQKMAKKRDLDINEHEATNIIKMCRGDYQNIDLTLSVLAQLPHGLEDLKAQG